MNRKHIFTFKQNLLSIIKKWHFQPQIDQYLLYHKVEYINNKTSQRQIVNVFIYPTNSLLNVKDN